MIFAEGMKPAEKKAESAPEKKAEPKKEQGKVPASKAEPAQKKPVQQSGQPMSRVPKTKVVDTSKATNINLAKYDEKLQDMADSRTGGGRRDQQQTQRKEKFRNS